MTYDRITGLLKSDTENIELAIFHELASTNDTVKSFAGSGKLGVVIANRQTMGRGRLGRSFEAPEGGLYISFIYRPEYDFTDIFSVMPLAALCVCDTVKSVCGEDCMIKWPNDVLLYGKKICGILAESYYKDSAGYLILGIGINFNSQLPAELTMASSVKELTGSETDLDDAAAHLIDSVFRLLNNTPEENKMLMDEYRSRCVNIGRDVTVTYNGRKTDGRVTGISDSGALIVRTGEDGSIEISSGEATLRE